MIPILHILFGVLFGAAFGIYVMEKITGRTKGLAIPALIIAVLFMALWFITIPFLKIYY